jgi:NADH:ubiquinone oxidoreductase subunit 6 (subunit J)
MVIWFYLFACAVIAGIASCIFARQIEGVLLGVALAATGVAGEFWLLNASYLALAQLVVWGAILLMMMTGMTLVRRGARVPGVGALEWVGASLAAIVVGVALVAVMWAGPWWIWVKAPEATANAQSIGRDLVSARGFMAPLLVMAILIATSAVGALYLVRRRRVVEPPLTPAKKIQTAPSRPRAGGVI